MRTTGLLTKHRIWVALQYLLFLQCNVKTGHCAISLLVLNVIL